MQFIQVVDGLLGQQNTTANKMLAELGLSSGLYSAWKRRGNTPDGDTLVKIADYFGVSVDYLLGRSALPEIQSEPLSPAEVRLIEMYRSASTEQREYIIATLAAVTIIKK